MVLSKLKPPAGSVKKAKRVGRGDGSGSGKTCGRGHKGYKSRSGGKVHRGYEGGQMPFHRRVPKRGFTNKFKTEYAIVNVGSLSVFDKEQVVDTQALIDKGIINRRNTLIKVLGNGDINTPIIVKAHKFSTAARKKIEAVQGKVEIL